MVIAGTDGIFEIEGGIDTVIDELKEMLQNKKPSNSTEFNNMLDELVSHIHQNYSLGDNATLGVIVTKNALSVFEEKRK